MFACRSEGRVSHRIVKARRISYTGFGAVVVMVIVAGLGRVRSAGLREAIEGGPTCGKTPHDVLDHPFTRHGKLRSIIGVDAGVFIALMSDPDGIATVLQHRIQCLKGVSANGAYLSG